MITSRPSKPIIEKCKIECKDPKNAKNGIDCCYFDCQSNGMGTIVNGSVQEQALLESFSESNTEKILGDEWKNVVKKSISDCVIKRENH